MREKKILIAVPCMDNLPARFCQSLAMLKKVGSTAIAFQIGSLIYDSREALAKEAVKMESDLILWLDSDMVFDSDLLERLITRMENNPEIDFLSGLYFRRVPPYTPVLFDKLEFVDGIQCNWNEFQQIPEDIFQAGGVGFGCVLMKTDIVFDVLGKFGCMFTPIGGTGEDLAFCWRARECGYKIFVDPTIPLGHIGNHVITRGYWEQYKDKVGD